MLPGIGVMTDVPASTQVIFYLIFTMFMFVAQ